MNQTSIMILQEQVLQAIVAARAEVNAALALLQAAVQQAGGGNVTLTAATLQAVLVRLRAAAQSLAAFRGQQTQMVRVVVGGIDVTATQNQILEALTAAAAAIDAQVAAIQGLLAQANAMGGAVVISQAAAQMLVASLSSIAQSLVALEARQRQLVNITTSGGGGAPAPAPTPGFPQFPQFPGFPGGLGGLGGLFGGGAGAFGGVAGQQGQGIFGNI
ncbi:MAG TPA: hypothetical protein VD973_23960 [Symbiobacteriaceae bacterium]|nr:hypothetical protein [Symbiobacteriaceae bacterium]